MTRRRATSQGHRRGFTLLETILASTVASLVLLAALGMFLTIARTEGALAARFEQTNELAWLQITTRRAMLSLVMGPNTLIDAEGQPIIPNGDTIPPRPRMVLIPDQNAEAYATLGRWARPSGTDQIQMFEVVLDAPPVPDALLGPAAGWATRAPADEMDFSLADLAGEDTGGVRGAFELRPDGVREKLMHSIGVAARDWPVREDNDPRAGWTLWWREYSLAEIAHLTAGGAPLPDDVTTQEGQERLLRAYPLVRGLDAVRWQVFNDNERVQAFSALVMNELPAYIELEVRTTTGKYANWMFEMGWRVGADPTDEDATTDDAADGDGADGLAAGAGGGGGGGAGRGGGRGGARGAGGRFRARDGDIDPQVGAGMRRGGLRPQPAGDQP